MYLIVNELKVKNKDVNKKLIVLIQRQIIKKYEFKVKIQGGLVYKFNKIQIK
jgi:hypothetical protein